MGSTVVVWLLCQLAARQARPPFACMASLWDLLPTTVLNSLKVWTLLLSVDPGPLDRLALCADLSKVPCDFSQMRYSQRMDGQSFNFPTLICTLNGNLLKCKRSCWRTYRELLLESAVLLNLMELNIEIQVIVLWSIVNLLQLHVHVLDKKSVDYQICTKQQTYTASC